jgi:hypothetical protein
LRLQIRIFCLFPTILIQDKCKQMQAKCKNEVND